MKKLMIAAAIVCAAAMSQAAVANWQASASAIYDGTGSSEASHKLASAVAVFFDAGSTTMKDVYDAVAGGTALDKVSGKVGTGTVATGGITAANAQFSAGTQGGSAMSFFFAIVNDDAIYFSNTLENVNPNGTDNPKTLSFSSQNADAKSTYSSLKAKTGYVGSGYWQTVPEPTSGLLLLLGVAGLALRRRRA